MKSKAYIDGVWVDRREKLDVTNPATGERIGALPDMGADETRSAINAAQKALKA